MLITEIKIYVELSLWGKVDEYLLLVLFSSLLFPKSKEKKKRSMKSHPQKSFQFSFVRGPLVLHLTIPSSTLTSTISRGAESVPLLRESLPSLRRCLFFLLQLAGCRLCTRQKRGRFIPCLHRRNFSFVQRNLMLLDLRRPMNWSIFLFSYLDH